MFGFFNKKKLQNSEEVISELKDDEIQLTSDELVEIDAIIESIEIMYVSIKQQLDELDDKSSSFVIEDNVDEEDIPEDKKQMLNFVKEGLNGVLDNFINFQREKIKEQLVQCEKKLSIWKKLKSKITNKATIKVGDIEVTDESLPFTIFMNKIIKTVEADPTLLNDSQMQRIKDFINSIMKEAFTC